MVRTPRDPDTVPPIDAQAVERQKTALLYRNAGVALGVNVIVASLLAAVNLGFGAAPAATTGWLGLLIAVCAARKALANRFLAVKPDETQTIKWRRRYIGATAAVACAWGAAPLLFMSGLPDMARLFTGLVLCGMVAGAVPILAPVPAAFRTFALLIALPTAGATLLQPGWPLQWAFVLMTIVFLAGVIASASFMHRTLDASIRLALEKSSLLEQLQHARGAAELALEASNLSLWEFDLAARTVHLDEHWHRVVGSEPGKRVVSMFQLARAIHPDDRRRVANAASDAIKGVVPGFREEFRVRSGSGDWQWITCRGKVIERSGDARALRALGTTIDISQRKAAETALAFSEKRYRTMFENAPIGIALTTFDGAIVAANEAMTRMFGYDRDPRARVNSRALYADDAKRDEWLALFRQCGSVRGFEAQFRRLDGSLFFGSLTVNRIDLERGAILLVMVEDITESRLWRERMYHDAHYDSLTDLPNRRLLLERAAQAMQDARLRGRSAAVLFLDLDNFKQINDSLGHDAGDQLLKEVAGRLKALVRRGDTVCRQGGDEFLIVLSDLEQPRDADLVARKILQALAAAVHLDGHQVTVGVSIGISLYPESAAQDAEALIKKADEAMYMAKQDGGNRYCDHDHVAMVPVAQCNLQINDSTRSGVTTVPDVGP